MIARNLRSSASFSISCLKVLVLLATTTSLTATIGYALVTFSFADRPHRSIALTRAFQTLITISNVDRTTSSGWTLAPMERRLVWFSPNGLQRDVGCRSAV